MKINSANVTSGFYDSVVDEAHPEGDRLYNTLQISSIFDGMLTDGVYSSIGKHFIVRPVNGLEVAVGSGRGWFKHSWILNDPDTPVHLNTADQLFTRIDIIAIDVDRGTDRSSSIVYIPGKASSDPKPEALIKDASKDHYQYPLAYITVKAKVHSVSEADIRNAVGTDECPFVTGILEHVTTNELIAQWQKQFDILYTDLKNKIDQLAQGAVPDGSVSSKYTVTVPTSKWSWTSETNGYYAAVTVTGLLDSDTPIVDAFINNKYKDENGYRESWGYIYQMTAKNNLLELWAVDKPTVDLELRLLCVRK